MEILRRKVKLNRPYAGVFTKKDDENFDEVVKDLDQVYPVGSFVQIMEMQDMGNKLRMVVMAHRRIKLLNSVVEEPEETESKPTEDATPRPETPPPSPEPYVDIHAVKAAKTDTEKPFEGILTVNTENLVHDPYETTAEIKALTQEVIKTIRDIIVSFKYFLRSE